MSNKTKRLFKKLISYSGIFFFVLAVGMLWWQLRNYSLRDIAHAIAAIPMASLIAACLACLAGYFALSLYDYLALWYVGEHKKVTWWKWMLAGMLGFAISNNAGHAVVSGGAIRYRLYTRWRIRGGDIVKMLTINGFTYFLGAAAIVIIGYFLVPRDAFPQAASVGLDTLFLFCGAAILAYFAMTLFFHKKSLNIGKLRFEIPTTRMALVQMLLGITDSLLAGLVLYFCMSPFINIPFGTYIGLFVIAQTTGVFSQVPGGIGVFETVFLVALPDTIDKANIFGALLAYRIIYYVLPLIGVGSLFFIYERWLRAKMRSWANRAKQRIDDARQKLPHIPKNRRVRK